MTQQAPSERITLLFEKFSSFVDGYGGNLSLGGMFLETEARREKGSIVDFEIKLTDGFRLLYGLGEVIWCRTVSGGPDLPLGLGIRFQALDDNGRELILKILEERVRNGHEPFDVEEIPRDVAMQAAGASILPPVDESPVDEPIPVAEPPVAEPSPEPEAVSEAPPTSEAAEGADTGAQRLVPADVEKKILGEDGFTLLDSEQRQADPGDVQTDKSFEELSFDAPWGEALPELPEEVLEEDSFVTAGDAAPAQPADEIPESPFLAEEVSEPSFAADEISEAPFAADESAGASFVADESAEASFVADDLSSFGADEFGADEPAEPPVTADESAEVSFAADDLPSFEADEISEPELPPKELAEASFAADQLSSFVAHSGSEPSFVLDDEEPVQTTEGTEAVGSGEEAEPEDPLEASLFLAAQAADEIDAAPPADEVLEEPDFHEIDFGTEGSEGLPEDLASGDTAGDFSFEADASSAEVNSAGAVTDFAFEPDPEDQLPPLELTATGAGDELEHGLGSEPPEGSGLVMEEDPTLLTSDPPMPGSDFPDDNPFTLDEVESDPFALDEEDATLVSASDAGHSVSPSEPDPFDVGDEDATLIGAGAPDAFALEEDVPGPAAVDARPAEMPDAAPGAPWSSDAASFEDLAGPGVPAPEAVDEPPVVSPEVPLAEAAPEQPSLWAPGGIGSVSEAPSAEPPPVEPPPVEPASTVTVGGAPAPVQDYEDDLFSDDAEAGSGQAARRAFSSKSLVAVAVLALLALAVFFFRDSLVEMTGLAGSGASGPVSSGTGSVPPVAAAPDPAGSGIAGTDPGAPASGEPPAVAEPGAGAPSTEGPTSADAVDVGSAPPEIEEVDVAETLPSAGAVAGDPEASPGSAPPAIESAVPVLAPVTSAASRIEDISWRQTGEGTRVTLRLDGALDENNYSHMALGYNPQREMIKLTGIEQPYARNKIDVGSAELMQIRTGYHAKADGAELHVVFDFPSVGPEVTSVRRLGDRLEILIQKP